MGTLGTLDQGRSGALAPPRPISSSISLPGRAGVRENDPLNEVPLKLCVRARQKLSAEAFICCNTIYSGNR
jgi:hypothetical protein